MIDLRLPKEPLHIISGYLYGECHASRLNEYINSRREELYKVKEKRPYRVSTEIVEEEEEEIDLITLYDFGNSHYLKVSHKRFSLEVKGLTLFEVEVVCLPNYYKYSKDRDEALEEYKNSQLALPIEASGNNLLLPIEGNEELLLDRLEGVNIRCAYNECLIDLSPSVTSASSKIAKVELREPTLSTPYYLLFIIYIHPKSIVLEEAVSSIEEALRDFHLTVECKPKYGFPPQNGFMGIALIPG